MYKEARKKAGFSTEEAALRNNIAVRTLMKYESGEVTPPPDIVVKMSRMYQQPWLTQHYCRRCEIGKAYSYEVLNNVDLSISGILMSLKEEMEEALKVFPRMLKVTRNKQSREEFENQEWEDFIRAMNEWIDLEHNIECLKIAFNKFMDVSELIKAHNEKCIAKHYVLEGELECIAQRQKR